MSHKSPEIIEVNIHEIEQLLDRAESNALREGDAELLRQFLMSYVNFFELVRDKNTTIARLRKLLFGATTESSKNLKGNRTDDDTASAADPSDETAQPGGENVTSPQESAPAPAGHGRHGADDYPGAERIDVPHTTLAAGACCPECGDGTLYAKKPVVLIRFVGQAPLQAKIYRLQRLRCHLCNRTFVADPPEGVGPEKYDASAASMIGLLKYGSGLPFNRLERLQGNCEIPLAASTQWDIVHTAAEDYAPAYEELIRQAADSDVVHNDDTTVKILEFMGERAKKAVFEDEQDPQRTGLFTSGVVGTRAGQRMALFFSGRQHAGENLSDVLRQRAEELNAPIQMCDGLSRNLPRELETILANCLAHGRRKFVELFDRFEEECRIVIDQLAVVYHNDSEARKQGLTDQERLTYHQTHSRPAMDALKTWLDRQLDAKLVEPNSALGEAIRYLLKRWEPLTLFLRQAGAPLDNNICERALKKVILHRKNSLFYKTRKGAHVGDMHMSLIYTCELNGVNPFEYLTQLQLHSAEVAEHPECWMPWNYQEHLERSQALELATC